MTPRVAGLGHSCMDAVNLMFANLRPFNLKDNIFSQVPHAISTALRLDPSPSLCENMDIILSMVLPTFYSFCECSHPSTIFSSQIFHAFDINPTVLAQQP